jgi:hypothetical protein
VFDIRIHTRNGMSRKEATQRATAPRDSDRVAALLACVARSNV